MYDMKALYEAESVENAVALRLEHPEAQIIAGGSDVLVQMREGKRAGKELISIYGLDELRGVSIDEEENIRIGSLSSFSHITRDPIIQKYINVLGEAVDMVGGPQIRNIGTIGGNTCNGVTSGDSASTLHAWEAIVELTGKNGVGKSTLALTLAGLLKPISGRVSMDETMVPARRENDVFTWKSRDLLGRIGMVFQEPEHQFVASSVRDEVAVGPKSMGKTDDEAYAIADMMLERLNLKRFAPANPFTLSGGEKRRLSVASMLAAAPKVLVMDEPTFGQDFTTWTEMVKLIAGARDAGCSVIMVTHDEPLIETLGARRVLVSEGE